MGNDYYYCVKPAEGILSGLSSFGVEALGAAFFGKEEHVQAAQ